MVKFGVPESFSKDHILRYEQLVYANGRFKQVSAQKALELKDKIDDKTKLFIKGYGTDKELISCFRELLFNSRELLDSLLFYINKITNNSTNKNFLPFAKSLMENEYDKYNLKIINFLKINFTYIFHIRKFRNELKNRPSNIEFVFVTNRIRARFKVPIKSDEQEFIRYLEINNKDEVEKNNSYFCTLILNEYFPEIVKFWDTVFKIMK